MELSSTSAALLGLLSVRDWTSYELAQQMKRSLRFFFPRAERHGYTEIKRLAEAGLARAEVSYTGKRRSTTYAITPAGTAALQAWLRTPPAAPVLEAEVVVRAFFAEAGRRQDLIAALAAAAAEARTAQDELAVLAQAWLDDEAPFPERRAMGALSMRFVADFQRLVEEWATWAAGEVATWKRTDGRGWEGADTVFTDIAAPARARPSPHRRG